MYEVTGLADIKSANHEMDISFIAGSSNMLGMKH